MPRSEETFATAQLIRDLYSLCMKRVGRSMADSGLSHQQAMIVRLLAHGKTLKVSDLCREMSLTKGTVSGILARMEEGGLIEKYKEGRDRRNTFVRFTDQGRLFASGSRGILADSFDRLFAGFTEEEIQETQDSLSGILAKMKKEDEEWTDD